MPSVICMHCGETTEIPQVRKRPLTKRQREIYDYIRAFSNENGYSPSYTTIMKRFGWTSIATAHELVMNLQRKGWIRKQFNRHNSIEVVEEANGH